MKSLHVSSLVLFASLSFSGTVSAQNDLKASIDQDYKKSLGALFDHFHRNPELSFVETKTAARLAQELRVAGFEVTENVGKTGVVAILKNGPGPLVMLRADMDGLPVQEKSGIKVKLLSLCSGFLLFMNNLCE